MKLNVLRMFSSTIACTIGQTRASGQASACQSDNHRAGVRKQPRAGILPAYWQVTITERPMLSTAARLPILALIAVSAALISTLSNPAEAPAPSSLKGQLLIATPAMRDTRFDRAVILMVRHDGDGAVGIVINRPLGEKPLAEILAALGAKDTAASG